MVCGQTGKIGRAVALLAMVVLLVVAVYLVVGDENKNRAGRVAARKAAPPAVPLTAVQVEEKVAALLLELRSIPVELYSENLTRYAKLVRLVPGEASYRKKRDHYESLIAAAKNAKIAAIERPGKIKAQFSPWGGEHIQLEKHVKRNLKDPASYEHIESRYNDHGDYIEVGLQYRARNSFGGFVVDTAQARCTVSGVCEFL